MGFPSASWHRPCLLLLFRRPVAYPTARFCQIRLSEIGFGYLSTLLLLPLALTTLFIGSETGFQALSSPALASPRGWHYKEVSHLPGTRHGERGMPCLIGPSCHTTFPMPRAEEPPVRPVQEPKLHPHASTCTSVSLTHSPPVRYLSSFYCHLASLWAVLLNRICGQALAFLRAYCTDISPTLSVCLETDLHDASHFLQICCACFAPGLNTYDTAILSKGYITSPPLRCSTIRHPHKPQTFPASLELRRFLPFALRFSLLVSSGLSS